MSETLNPDEVIVPSTEEIQPIAEPLVEPTPEPVILRYEYQPTDENNRPIGGKQVIKYTTHEELVEKLAKQNVELVRKLRSETRKNRLGIVDEERIEEEAPRFQRPIAFAPKALSAEEQLQLSRTLGIDPEDFDTATDALFEAKIGVKPADLRGTLAEIQEERFAARAQAEVNAFMAANPSYVKCQENFEAITNWMLRYDLAPVKSNFEKAYNTLKAAGILVETYAEPVPEPQPVAQVEPVIIEPVVVPVAEALVETPTAPVVSTVPLSFTKTNTTETGVSPRDTTGGITYEVMVGGQKRIWTGLAAVDAMPSEEFKRRVQGDPTFVKRVEKLEAEALERRKARR